MPQAVKAFECDKQVQDLHSDSESTAAGSPGTPKSEAPLPAPGPRPAQFQGAFEKNLALNVVRMLRSSESCCVALGRASGSGLNSVATLLWRCFRLLRIAGHSEEAVQLAAAHGAWYMCNLQAKSKEERAKVLPLQEFGYVLCLFVFLGHVHTEDCSLPLKAWHQHVFAKYCSLSVLSAAVMAMLGKLDYRLRMPEQELQMQLDVLAATRV
jgi:hypothetical protein